MTLMVRDEVDVVEAMLLHHLAQGVDQFIVTDNGSVDGTIDVLRKFEARGVVDLRHDPVQRKQQALLVTKMARDAYRIYGADWVLNADADEFWVAQDKRSTVREVLARVNKDFQSFRVPVVDMIGPPAKAGSGLRRLVYRDNRTNEALRRVGLLAHSAPNAVHVGDESIEVSQGNHEVNLRSLGSPAEGKSLEVLHFQWRSWEQFARKVENAGRSYEANPTLKPSPNHHGMRDYNRLKAGLLLGSYLARHPSQDELAVGVEDGTFERDDRIAEQHLPSAPDLPFEAGQVDQEIARVTPILAAESRVRELTDLVKTNQTAFAERETELAAQLRSQALETQALIVRLTALEHQLQRVQQRRSVRTVDALARLARRLGAKEVK